jgi:hypothetical protein
MMATGTPTGPLENDGEVGVRSGDTDDLSDPFYRAGFECDVFNARVSPSMISAAFSVLGIPAATQKPSIGNPSFLMSCHNGSWKENCCGLM